MREAETVNRADAPNTRESIADALRNLGLYPGMTVVVHSSLSALGWVCGGSVSVILALMDVVTSTGTIVMPAFSGDYSDPARWRNPPVPQSWWPVIRETMPAFDVDYTPTRGVGIVPEVFRKFPGVIRSNHPSVSFAAWGKHSLGVTVDHSLEYPLGEISPLGRIYELDGWVLLLGAGYDRNTSFHLAEYRAKNAISVLAGSPVWENGQRTWRWYKDIESDAGELFTTIGSDFEKNMTVGEGRVGVANATLFRQRAAVDFAVPRITEARLQKYPQG